MDVKIKSMTNVKSKLQIENADPVNSRHQSHYTACLFVFTAVSTQVLFLIHCVLISMSALIRLHMRVADLRF